MTQDPTPAEALASIRESGAAVAARMGEKSWTYDLIYSSLLAVMIGAHAFPSPIGVLGSAFGGLGVALLARKWSERTGVFVSGVSPRRARWVAFGLGVVLVAMIGAVIWGRAQGLWWLPLPLAAAAFLVGLVSSRLWWRVYRAEMGLK